MDPSLIYTGRAGRFPIFYFFYSVFSLSHSHPPLFAQYLNSSFVFRFLSQSTPSFLYLRINLTLTLFLPSIYTIFLFSILFFGLFFRFTLFNNFSYLLLQVQVQGKGKGKGKRNPKLVLLRVCNGSNPSLLFNYGSVSLTEFTAVPAPLSSVVSNCYYFRYKLKNAINCLNALHNTLIYNAH